MWKLALLSIALFAAVHAQLDMESDMMGFEDNIAQESHSDEQLFAVTSKPLLNDGKPFYVARDPTTGTFDFNMKKTVGIQNDIPISRKDELSGASKSGHDINSIHGQNFHDFLNLPVKYSSAKFVHPLVSGSYANLKYQGNNKNSVSNHKNYTTTLGTSTQSPKYFTHIANPTANPVKNTFTATFKHPETTQRPTTQKPITTESTTTTEKSTTTAPSTTQSTSVKYSSTIVQQNSFPSTFKNKYVDSSETRKKTTMATTTTKVQPKPTLPANPVKFLDDLLESVENKETKPTTYRPPFSATRLSFSTSMPLVPSAFKPLPTESFKPPSQKITFESGARDPSTMTLSEIINSISSNDDLSGEQNSIAYETADSSQIEIKKLTLTAAPVLQKTTQAQHKTLQQHLHNQQQGLPQFVELPVHQPLQFAPKPPMTNVGFPNEQFEDYVEFENPEDQYVKYEVQKPNVNLVKFQQIPSMNNVVISPGQNSASFVLGSQQSVGSVGIGSSLGVGSSNFAENNGPMKVGQVINDDPPVRSLANPINNQIQASIRFPSDAENAFDNAPIVKGTIKIDGSAESVQPPQALSQNQPTQKTFFPTNQQKMGQDINTELTYGKPIQGSSPQPSHIIFENVNDIYEKINDKRQKQEIALAEISNNIAAGELTPPGVLTPPSPTQQRPFNRQQQQPPQPHFNVRRPGPPPRQNYPGLPNILPQFRPNAKASQGHPQMYKDVGAIRIPMQGQIPYHRQYPQQVSQPKIGLPPQQNQNQQNPNFRQNPNRPFVMRGNGPPPQYEQSVENGNRRVFRLPPPQMNDPNAFMRPPPVSPPSFQLKRQQNGAPETMQMQQRPSNVPQTGDFMQQRPSNVQQSPNFPQQRPGNNQQPEFELNKLAPPQALPQFAPRPVESKNDSNNPLLEPVITLQMLQSKKTGGKLNLPPVPHDIPQDIQIPIPSNHKEENVKKPSIYVVYPVSSNSFENSEQLTGSSEKSSVANRGESQIPSGVSEYQNTPFSVVSHFEQEPLLMKKEKKKNQFPYHLERPAPSNEFKNDRPKYGLASDGSLFNIGEEPSSLRVVNKRPPFISENPNEAISSKLQRVTDKPIAIAYTPTEPTRIYSPHTNFYHNPQPHQPYSHHYNPNLSGDKFSLPNYGGPVISEILDEKRINYDYYHRQQQLQQNLNNGEDLDFYKEHYDFEAPFQASVSLTPEVTNPYEGWSIVTQSTDTNKIDRSDLHVVDSSEELTTRKFDPTEFLPVYESGFQPIYSERKVSTAPELFADSESSELPSTLGLIFTTQTTTMTTTPAPTTNSAETSPEAKSSEETTTYKIEKKKQKVEIDSLEGNLIICWS